jgi:hypothetical protein
MQVGLAPLSGQRCARYYVICASDDAPAAELFAASVAASYRDCWLGQLVPFPPSQLFPSGAIICPEDTQAGQAAPAAAGAQNAPLAQRAAELWHAASDASPAAAVAAPIPSGYPSQAGTADVAGAAAPAATTPPRADPGEASDDDVHVPFVLPSTPGMPSYASAAQQACAAPAECASGAAGAEHNSAGQSQLPIDSHRTAVCHGAWGAHRTQRRYVTLCILFWMTSCRLIPGNSRADTWQQ